jgi:cytidylate kinase
MYRAATVYCLAQEVPLDDEVAVMCAVMQLAQETGDGFGLSMSLDPDERSVVVGGVDVTSQIREDTISDNVKHISGNLPAREYLVKMQQDTVAEFADKGIVLEGRDVTDVIAPDAAVRVVLVADEAVRAGRRAAEQAEGAGQANAETNAEAVAQVERAIHERDAADSKVNNFLHAQGSGVVELDNSELTLDETVDAVLKLLD